MADGLSVMGMVSGVDQEHSHEEGPQKVQMRKVGLLGYAKIRRLQTNSRLRVKHAVRHASQAGAHA